MMDKKPTTIILNGPVTIVHTGAQQAPETYPMAYIVEWLQGALESGQALAMIEERMAQSSMSESPTETMLRALIDLAAVHRT